MLEKPKENLNDRISVFCHNCKKEIPLSESHRLEWNGGGGAWYLCDECFDGMVGTSQEDIYKNKEEFVNKLAIALTYPGTGIQDVKYRKDGREEYAYVTYEGHAVRTVLVTGDSLIAIFKDIARSIDL